MYENAIYGLLLRATLFSNNRAPGSRYIHYFDPIQEGTIATLSTIVSHHTVRAIQISSHLQIICLLDEYKTGEFVPVVFDAKNYASVYTECLNHFRIVQTGIPNIIDGVLTEMLSFVK